MPTRSRPPPRYGLMQLLPSTHARRASPARRRRRAPRSSIPTINIDLGTRYLRQLLDRYDGKLAKALAAYNAGEDAVAKWERRYAGAADRRVRRADQLSRDARLREAGARQLSSLPPALRSARRARAPSSARADATARRQPSAATSLPASPPNAPFDMITTTSPGARLTRDQ